MSGYLKSVELPPDVVPMLITLDSKTGLVNVEGPLENPAVCFTMLEMTRVIVIEGMLKLRQRNAVNLPMPDLAAMMRNGRMTRPPGMARPPGG